MTDNSASVDPSGDSTMGVDNDNSTPGLGCLPNLGAAIPSLSCIKEPPIDPDASGVSTAGKRLDWATESEGIIDDTSQAAASSSSVKNEVAKIEAGSKDTPSSVSVVNDNTNAVDLESTDEEHPTGAHTVRKKEEADVTGDRPGTDAKSEKSESSSDDDQPQDDGDEAMLEALSAPGEEAALQAEIELRANARAAVSYTHLTLPTKA